ncbi:hypothetical protein F2P81_011120 [Scophthalmus maximus]|uniref:Uncharacterized protein n=1 Tax=Scophthalmus maximus TaxID=52904 RepID=A0A6A4SUL6_SCOMX|nr:hypothetical protein F2P81_011120 [Scophthalmus maximus]
MSTRAAARPRVQLVKRIDVLEIYWTHGVAASKRPTTLVFPAASYSDRGWRGSRTVEASRKNADGGGSRRRANRVKNKPRGASGKEMCRSWKIQSSDTFIVFRLIYGFSGAS